MYYVWEQWLILFFVYAAIGWVWESLYVSAKERAWVNRGFLNGPILPIYGFGAVIILFLTLPVSKNVFLIFLFGMAGATALEFATGFVMEQIFKVRYWDYSQKHFNLCGYICLYASLGWGVFSVVLVRFVHPFADGIVRSIPMVWLKPVSNIFMVLFVADTVLSVRNALDMKELLSKVTENNRLVNSVKSKLENSASAVREKTAGVAEYLKTFEDDRKRLKEQLSQKSREYRSKPKLFALKLRENKEERSGILETVYKKIDSAVEEAYCELQSCTDEEGKAKLRRNIEALNEIKHDIKRIEINVLTRKNKDYERAARMVMRNPSSASARFKDAFSEIKGMILKRR